MRFLRSKTLPDRVHRCGWNWVLDHMIRHLGAKFEDLIMDDYIEATMFWPNTPHCNMSLFEKRFGEPWVGFLHHPEAVPYPYPCWQSMAAIFADMSFRASLGKCRALFTLCKHNAVCVRELLTFHDIKKMPVFSLLHPTSFDVPQWTRLADDWSLLGVGCWMKDLGALWRFDHPRKVCLNGQGDEKAWQYYLDTTERGFPVKRPGYLDDAEYDHLLSRNLAFTHLLGNGANNTVLDCVARGTPLLVNRMPCTIEYLGADYPMLWEDLRDAGYKMSLAHEATHHLRRPELRARFTIEKFLDDLTTALSSL